MSAPTSKTLDQREQEVQDTITQFKRSDLVLVDDNPYLHGYVIEQIGEDVRVRMNGTGKVRELNASRLTDAKAWTQKKIDISTHWTKGK